MRLNFTEPLSIKESRVLLKISLEMFTSIVSFTNLNTLSLPHFLPFQCSDPWNNKHFYFSVIDYIWYLICCAVDIHLEIIRFSNTNYYYFLITYKVNNFNNFLLMLVPLCNSQNRELIFAIFYVDKDILSLNATFLLILFQYIFINSYFL